MIYTNPPVRAKAAPTIPTSLKPAILDEVMRPKSYKTLCIMLLPRHKFGTEPSWTDPQVDYGKEIAFPA